MKAICLATLMTLVLMAVVTADARWRRRPQVAGMTRVFWVLLLALAGLWWETPADLGFLPPALMATPAWLDAAATLFLFAAGFWGGVLQLYNLADRGFSLRILIDCLENGRGTIDAGDVASGYSAGQGIAWMYRKRLDGMQHGRFIELREGDATLTAKGEATAAAFAVLRRFSRLEAAEP